LPVEEEGGLTIRGCAITSSSGSLRIAGSRIGPAGRLGRVGRAFAHAVSREAMHDRHALPHNLSACQVNPAMTVAEYQRPGAVKRLSMTDD